MRLARYIGVGVLAYSLAFGFIYSTEHLHRQAFDRAFFAWYKNPTAENEAALKREQHVNSVIRLQDSAIGAAILVAAGYGAWAIFRIAKRKLQ
jgi:fatty acid-binding protein DegV